MAFPSTILSLADAIASQKTRLAWGGTIGMAAGLNSIKADLIAALTKLGTGASTASANTVLRGTGSGTTAFGQIVSADITDGTIVAADLSSSAGLAVTQLAAGTNKTLVTSNGSANSFSASPTVSGTFTAETALLVGAANLGFKVVGQGTRTSGQSFTIASNSAGNQGFLFVTNISQGKSAIFSVNGNFDFTELLCGSSTHFSVTNATGSKVNVFSDGSNYFVQNGWASTQTIQAWYAGVSL